MRSSCTSLLTALFLVSFPVAGMAHGGGLNAEGCHNNRKTGDYHCHRTPSKGFAYGGGSSVERVSPVSPSGARRGAFKNCAEARAAGAAPVRRGDPGYGPHLDRDNDGIGCE
jgi:hypothetical protein